MALRIPRLRINKLWLLLIVAVLLGLLATWLSVSYLKTREQRIAADLAQKAKGGPTVAVVVPVRNAPKGTAVDQTVVAAREIAADLVYSDTITADQFDQVAGKRLLRDVEQGRPLRRADVFDDRAKDFSDLVEPGMRAVTIEIDELNSFAGMLKPGNLVDLLLITTEQQVPGGPPSMGGQEVLDLMQKVKVLATGQTLQGEGSAEVPQALQEGGAPRRTAYSNITVEVTPEQAAKITLGMQSGKVRMALRNTKDGRETVLGLINTESLYDGVPPQARVKVAQRSMRNRMQSRIAPDGGDYVEYIVGGRSSGTGAAAPININLPQLPPGASIPGVTSSGAAAEQSAMASPGQNPAFSSLPPSITSGIPSVPTGAASR